LAHGAATSDPLRITQVNAALTAFANLIEELMRIAQSWISPRAFITS
jgi:hypothetical protein